MALVASVVKERVLEEHRHQLVRDALETGRETRRTMNQNPATLDHSTAKLLDKYDEDSSTKPATRSKPKCKARLLENSDTFRSRALDNNRPETTPYPKCNALNVINTNRKKRKNTAPSQTNGTKKQPNGGIAVRHDNS